MSTNPTCITCRHSFGRHANAGHLQCEKGAYLDNVDGLKYRDCRSMRSNTSCGPEGALWEANTITRFRNWLSGLLGRS